MPQNLIRTEINTPIGPIGLVIDGAVIVICEFADRQHRIDRQLERFYSDRDITKDEAPKEIAQAFSSYFDGNTNALDKLKTAPSGTAFEQSVWKALRATKAGETDSYGALAKRIGSSPRAVGRANGRNPVCLIHPCHRIIGADGALTGYAGGLDRKEWLLVHEGAL